MIMLTVILGAVLTTFGLIFTENVAVFFGATPEMLGDCVLYGRIVISFTTAFMLQNVFQSFFIAAEKPKLGLISTIMAGCTNIILCLLYTSKTSYGISGYKHLGREPYFSAEKHLLYITAGQLLYSVVYRRGVNIKIVYDLLCKLLCKLAVYERTGIMVIGL